VTSPEDFSELVTVEMETSWPRPCRSSRANLFPAAADAARTSIPAAANDTASEPSVSQQEPLWRRASTEVLALVIDAEIAALLRRPIAKDQALVALAPRQELADRMRRHRWLAIETARAVGATWDEIDTALGYRPGLARREHQTALSRQKSLGLVVTDRHDPGTPEGPHL
jgi:hypothetical protein